MSTALVVAALVSAALLLPTVALLLVWGLLGGDGKPRGPVHVALGCAVGLGSLLNVGATWRALDGIGAAAWWLMWIPTAAAVAALPLLSGQPGARPGRSDLALGLLLAAALGLPAALVALGGGVTA
ncbi:hypothetical protein ACFP3Q_11185 [Nocardioides sp. GCM10027113]|uniref:hypothetical protein n=1 Tax=unclassified Nocardioides TaxID=2615069 RepID=UPI003611A1DC